MSSDNRKRRRFFRLRESQWRLWGSWLNGVSVFNHYNRVRANVQALEVEEDESGWSEDSQPDGERPSPFASLVVDSSRFKAGRTGVVPVHLNPHPRRSHHLQGGSLPFQLRYSVPTFEKSNVLVLCVILLYLVSHVFIRQLSLQRADWFR